MKAIVYSLFGYSAPKNKDCFDFNSYLRGLMINIRMARLLYPGWKIIIEIDEPTYDEWGKFLNALPIIVHVNEVAPLTKAMLWRFNPIFEHDGNQNKVYSHVLLRDLDSPITYREVQAVTYWMNQDKAAHAITDSISHNIPMLGGMIGFQPKHFTMLTGILSRGAFELAMRESKIDFSKKGADQTFINKYLYPFFAKSGSDSITQHYIKGMPNTFLSDYHSQIQDIKLPIPEELKESNTVCGHIGAAGYYEGELFKFLRKYQGQFNDLVKYEMDFPNIFFWVNEI